MNNLIPTEAQEQEIIIKYCNLKNIPIFHIPNGSYKSITARIRAKREGLSAGVPDLMIPLVNNDFAGLFIELKRIKRSKVSPKQLKWIDELNNNGYRAVVCYGAKEAIKTIEEYMQNIPNKG